MQPGDLLDHRFRLQRVAGTGGMGAVYQARDKLSGARVALKVLAGLSGPPSRAVCPSTAGCWSGADPCAPLLGPPLSDDARP